MNKSGIEGNSYLRIWDLLVADTHYEYEITNDRGSACRGEYVPAPIYKSPVAP